MKRFTTLLIVLFLAGFVTAQAPASTPAADTLAAVIGEASQQGWLQINAETAMTQIDAIDPFVIDVRSQTEWDEQGHIPGAVLMPVTELATMLEQLPADLDTPMIVYCAKGTRGNYGMLYLKALGYSNVKNLGGGFGAWVEAGLPVE